MGARPHRSWPGYIRVVTGKYNQISVETRHQIEALLKERLNQTEIANNIGVDRSTLNQELKHNVTNNGPAMAIQFVRYLCLGFSTLMAALD